jgi:hypothetical protein
MISYHKDEDIIVSVIIVNYKTQDLIVETITSIFEHTKKISFEIIVVDNNSNDNSQNIIKHKFDGKVKYLSLEVNLGFGKANNEGAKIACGKYLLFLNSDTTLINNSIEILANFLDKNEHVGICGGNLYTENLKPAHSCMPVLPSLYLEIDSLFWHIPSKLVWGKNFDFNTSNKPKKVADIIGADLMIRTEIFNNLKGFDPEFFLYNEESELAFRVKKAGYSIYSIPDAKIIHLEGRSMSSEISKRKFGLISRKQYYKKTQKLITRILIDIVFIIKSLLGIFFSILTSKKDYLQYWLFALKNGMIEIW